MSDDRRKPQARSVRVGGTSAAGSTRSGTSSRRPANGAGSSRTSGSPRSSGTSRTAKARTRSGAGHRRPPARSNPRPQPVHWPLSRTATRLNAVLVVCAILLSLCAGRLLQVQAFDTEGDAAAAAARLQQAQPIPAARGEITDAYGSVLATTEPAFAITADPTLTSPDAAAIADVLVSHLGGQPADYLPALTKPDARFAYVAKKVPAATYARVVAELNDRELKGIYREVDPIRSYPNNGLASNIVGFTGWDGKGQGGLELSMDDQLSGTDGKEVYDQAPNGNRIPLGSNVLDKAVNGTNYQLTIDAELQWMVERGLAQQAKDTKSKTGTVVVMNVKTGELLALANYPSFDSNKPGAGKPDDLGNRAVQSAYEPGSVQKVLTMAAVIDDGKAADDTRVVVPGRIQSGDLKIKDVWEHGQIKLTPRGILAKSSNIGTVLVARQIPKQRLYDRLRDFGLGQPTGIELPGEAAGYLPSRDMPDYSRDQIAFGQGLSVTAVQEAAAVAGIVNGGVYNPPTIVKGATDTNGNPVEVTRPEPRRVVSDKTSTMVTSMMEAILDRDGYQKMVGVQNYRSGGKTGTAQRYNADCNCYRGRTTSYVGVAPIEDPEILTYVVLDDVRGGDSGARTAGPLFRDVMEFALPRYGVLPSTTKPTTGGQEW
ncbi:MAG: penicillin-binding protein 2 [Propionibacteriales bacterium]|nr:penicillin-binding protein 2 [Propionibacteriales bacterium]